MSFVAAGTFVVGAESAAAIGALGTGLIGGALVGAGTGALVNGLTGRSVLNGALIGGAIGAGGGALGGAFAGAGALGAGTEVTGQIGADIASMQAAGASSAEISQALMDTYGMTADQAATTMSQVASTGTTAGGINMGTTAAQQLQAANMVKNVAGATDQPQAQPNQTSTYTPQLTPSSTSPSAYTDPYAAQDVMQQARDTSSSAPTPSAWNMPSADNSPGMFSQITDYMKAHPGLTATAAGAALLASQGKKAFQPNYLPTYTPPSAASYGLGRTMASNYQPTRAMAEGGIASLADGGLLQNGQAQVNFMGSDMYPQSQIQRSYYATPTQMPTSAQQTMAGYEPKTNPLTGELTANMAKGGVTKLALGGSASASAVNNGPLTAPASGSIADLVSQAINQPSSNAPLYGGITAAGETGLKPQSPNQPQAQPVTMGYIQSLANQYGVVLPTKNAAKGGTMGGDYNLGSYSDGGRLLKGPGDGMSDDIPASIADKQPARLADGEFVVPADVVSHLGNGSTDAGAKHLYKMMDNVRKARTGNKQQGKQIKADKYLPK